MFSLTAISIGLIVVPSTAHLSCWHVIIEYAVAHGAEMLTAVAVVEYNAYVLRDAWLTRTAFSPHLLDLLWPGRLIVE
jgi:hypothetical protein